MDDKGNAYSVYFKSLGEITEFLRNEEAIDVEAQQSKQSELSDIENRYVRSIEELQKVRQSILQQFRSVRESYTGFTGIPTPESYRPLETELDWKESIRNLEGGARSLSQWFSEKYRQAAQERRNAMIKQSEQEAVYAREQAERRRKEEEERKRREKEEAVLLLEEMKKKYRKW